MIEILGWMAFAFGGGYMVGGVGFLIGAGKGGLESLGVGIGMAAIFAMAWVCFVAWLSPLTIGFTG